MKSIIKKFYNSKVVTRYLIKIALYKHLYTSRKVLAALDDSMLEDIGITRVDAENEAARPFWQSNNNYFVNDKCKLKHNSQLRSFN